jgi:hypothetical protein
MSKKVKTVRQTCMCENCGNEAEMIITCTLDDSHKHEEKKSEQKTQGLATCTNCGNESDMWIDL